MQGGFARGGALVAGLVVALVGTAGSVREARACTCQLPDHVAPQTYPADGATDVPTNTRFLVVRQFSGAPELELQRESTSAAVPLDVERWELWRGRDFWAWAAPVDPLEPGQAYVLFVDGEQHSRFTVGAAADGQAPQYDGVTAIEVNGYLNPGDCHSGICWDSEGRLDSVPLELAPPPADAVVLMLELSGEDGGPVTRMPVRRDPDTGRAQLADHRCFLEAPGLEPGASYCARVVAVDGAGNASDSPRRCATARECAIEDCNSALEGCDQGSPSGGDSGGGGCRAASGGSGALGGLPALVALMAGRRRR